MCLKPEWLEQICLIHGKAGASGKTKPRLNNPTGSSYLLTVEGDQNGFSCMGTDVSTARVLAGLEPSPAGVGWGIRPREFGHSFDMCKKKLTSQASLKPG